MNTSVAPRPPLPPFTLETATAKVRSAEDAWNTREPERVSMAYSQESRWRNRSEFFTGREAIYRSSSSINDVKIAEEERLFRWPSGPRPADHPGLSELDLL
ncbi:MAG TPA: DUF1348 family protein [Candidatus Baltobacteraceae bacterium]|nr:DUF1348 family protein [Candidatus Baltobacteraceae bacterium]